MVAFPKEEVREILLMNTDEIRAFAAQKDIELFKFTDPIPSESKDVAQQLLASLPEVDQSAFRPYKDLFDGSTLGVYFSKYNSTLNLSKDTILFSDQADRWTIAHEMGHALIDKNRADEVKKDETATLEKIRNAKEDYEEVMSLYRNLGFFPSTSYMVTAFHSIEVWTTLLLDSLYTYELEEVRIERYLIGLYEKEPNLKLDSHTYKRSFWYIKKNCTSANMKLNISREILEYFHSIVTDVFRDQFSKEFSKNRERLNKHEKIIQELCS